MSLKELYESIIPPPRYEFRNGFSNIEILDKLVGDDKLKVTKMLIEEIKQSDEMDDLVVNTLVYLDEKLAILTISDLLDQSHTSIDSLFLITTLYKLNPEEALIKEAILVFEEIKDEYILVTAIHYLSLIDNDMVRNKITELTYHSNTLVSNRAKQYL